ncbi:MAG: hypothetical protein A3J50_04390 [Candidatus Woykebacteria bacterium RIFCSPHIGHO2_02_FULL_43_16b]|uniref:Uncharacterized protein n=1 Tax=Candidatus Woykebacteria bacterium RIFCSPHIGHO2_02_FULL_43_16b TaxID=1802601 RepID=A0A1G1WRB6_9BACT|nr:MAG: hypothetical protein A3J50_04390 [Candidatus Woykebacteria bacterium RIFCSPHIGHO2_02_FULL_43_16b]
MIDRFLNFYSKYPWTALIIVMQWVATAFTLTYSVTDESKILLMTFSSTVLFAFFGFKIPKD